MIIITTVTTRTSSWRYPMLTFTSCHSWLQQSLLFLRLPTDLLWRIRLLLLLFTRRRDTGWGEFCTLYQIWPRGRLSLLLSHMRALKFKEDHSTQQPLGMKNKMEYMSVLLVWQTYSMSLVYIMWCDEMHSRTLPSNSTIDFCGHFLLVVLSALGMQHPYLVNQFWYDKSTIQQWKRLLLLCGIISIMIWLISILFWWHSWHWLSHMFH